MKELKVDINMCIGCGACAAIDSEHFTINDAGLSETTSQENLESPAVNEAIDACPVGAITLEEKKGVPVSPVNTVTQNVNSQPVDVSATNVKVEEKKEN